MAPPIVFLERDLKYRIGAGVLLLATVLAVFGIISPGWYSIAHVLTGTSGYSHLWIFCINGLYRCNVLGTENTESFEKATEAFVLIGLFTLFASCLIGVFLNFVSPSRAHNRWLEITALVGGGCIFLGAIIFVGAGSSRIANRPTDPDHLSPLGPLSLYDLSFGYALVLTFIAAILATIAGVLIFIFNRPLEVPSDVRTLSTLRNNDPVDRLHDDIEDSEAGFRSARLTATAPSTSRSSTSSRPPDYDTWVRENNANAHTDQPRFRISPRDGSQNHARPPGERDLDVSSVHLGLPSEDVRLGLSNGAYLADPTDETDHHHLSRDNVQSHSQPHSQQGHSVRLGTKKRAYVPGPSVPDVRMGTMNRAYEPDPLDEADDSYSRNDNVQVHSHPNGSSQPSGYTASSYSADRDGHDYEVLRKDKNLGIAGNNAGIKKPVMKGTHDERYPRNQEYSDSELEEAANNFRSVNPLARIATDTVNPLAHAATGAVNSIGGRVHKGVNERIPPSHRPRHRSEERRERQNGHVYGNMTSGHREETRHFSDGDDVDDDAGFRPYYGKQPRHFSDPSGEPHNVNPLVYAATGAVNSISGHLHNGVNEKLANKEYLRHLSEPAGNQRHLSDAPADRDHPRHFSDTSAHTRYSRRASDASSNVDHPRDYNASLNNTEIPQYYSGRETDSHRYENVPSTLRQTSRHFSEDEETNPSRYDVMNTSRQRYQPDDEYDTSRQTYQHDDVLKTSRQKYQPGDYTNVNKTNARMRHQYDVTGHSPRRDGEMQHAGHPDVIRESVEGETNHRHRMDYDVDYDDDDINSADVDVPYGVPPPSYTYKPTSL